MTDGHLPIFRVPAWLDLPASCVVLFLAFYAGGVSVALAEDHLQNVSSLTPRNVVAVVPHLWPPQYSTDENGQPAGFAIDVMEAVAAKAGLNVTYKIVDSFANAVSTLKNGDAEPNEDNGICLKVEDTGIGINEEDISKIILPFGQARDIFARNHEGTGLGLSLAKSLVELHEGTLEIKSQEGKGTTVIVKLPAGRG